MSVHEKMRNGIFAMLESAQDEEDNVWFYKYDPQSGDAVLTPESVTKTLRYGYEYTEVVPGLRPSDVDVLKLPQELNGHKIVGIHMFAFDGLTKDPEYGPMKRRWPKTVQFHEGIKYIAPWAFRKCESIVHLTGVFSPETIGMEAFENCKRLQSIEFGSGVRTIGRRAFASCSSLLSVRFDEGTVEIEDEAFAQCSIKEQVDLPDSVYFVAENAFDGSQCRITYPEHLGFGFAPSVRWRMRTNSTVKRELFNFFQRENLFKPSRFQ